MEYSLLKYKILKNSLRHSCCLDIMGCMFVISLPFFHNNSKLRVFQIIICFFLLVYGYLEFIGLIRDYRYSCKRKVSITMFRGLSNNHLIVTIGLIFLPIVDNIFHIFIILFTNGLLFLFFSKEIERAYSLGFEHCGNWQIRRVLGISLMVLPLLFYALVFLSRLLYN